MRVERKNARYESVMVAKAIMMAFCTVLATFTVITHLAQLSAVSFQAYAITGTVAAAGALAVAVRWFRKDISSGSVRDRRVLLLLLCLALCGGILALVIHRPDSDDFFYVPNAVFYLQHPYQKMGFDIHFVHSSGLPFRSIVTNTAFPYEYMQGALAYLCGFQYLFVYHQLFCALVGLMVPLAYFYAISRFGADSGKAVLGAVVTVAIVLLLGEAHRSIGNLAFARAFQGKVLFLSVGLPLFTALSFEYFEAPSFKTWWPLAVAATAMAGATATSVVMLPALASALALAMTKWRSAPGKLLATWSGYFASLGYLFAYALAVRGDAVAHHGMASPQNQGWPTTVGGTVGALTDFAFPLSLYVAAAAFVVCLVLCERRKELLIWTAASIALYLNPVVAPFMIKYVTSPNIYWRMFYMLPFPLVIGIAATSLLSLTEHRFSLRTQGVIAGTVIVVLFAVNLTTRNTAIFSPHNGAQLAFPGYKIDASMLESAREVVAAAPAGVMLAPVEISGTVCLLNSRFPQIAYRKSGLLPWLFYRGKGSEGEDRLAASAFLSGDNGDIAPLKRMLAAYPELASVVTGASVWQRPDLQQALTEQGFDRHKRVGAHLMLCWKSRLSLSKETGNKA